MRTKVRVAPSPRKLSVEVPVAPFATFEVCETNTFGRMFTTSSILDAPRLSISCAPICTRGTEEVTLDLVNREPVTTSSSISSSCANALGANPVDPAAIAANAKLKADALRLNLNINCSPMNT